MPSSHRVAWTLLGVLLGYCCPLPSALHVAALTAAPASVADSGGCDGVPAEECSLRQRQCRPVSDLVQGTGGPVGAVFTCATQLAIPKTQVTPLIGPAFSAGHPEAIVDQITNDTAAALRLRRCMLTSAGLLGINDTINLEALVARVQAKLSWNPPLASIISASLRACPQPLDLKYTELLGCVRLQCIRAVTVATFAFPPPGSAANTKPAKKRGCKKCKKH